MSSYVPSHCSHYHCDPINLAASEWVQLYPFCHSGSIGKLTGSEWFQARYSCVPSHCPHYWHSGPIALTASEWFLARSNCILSYCPHNYFDAIDLTACELFYVNPSYVFSYSYCYWLDSLWVILCQVWQLCPSHCHHCHTGFVCLSACGWFHTRASYVHSHHPLSMCWLDSLWVILWPPLCSFSNDQLVVIIFIESKLLHIIFSWLISHHGSLLQFTPANCYQHEFKTFLLIC